MNSLEIERKKLELRKVETARAEMEFKILEKLSDIERIKEQIKLQDSGIEALKQTINAMSEG